MSNKTEGISVHKYCWDNINIDHCSDGALLIYYNKDETEFLAPKMKLI
jgi:hypothetical protein